MNTVARLRRIMIFSDSHPTRITLCLAELLMALSLVLTGDNDLTKALVLVAPRWLWASTFGLAAVLNGLILLRGRYGFLDALAFAALDAILWIYVASVRAEFTKLLPAPELALVIASSWVFISTGFSTYGKRSTDYDQ